MSKRNAQPITAYFDSEAEISVIIDTHPPRQEECHGIHTFDESEEVDRELISFKIFINANEYIDITDRLTPEEKSKILKESEKQ
jgi:hypothetical protein